MCCNLPVPATSEWSWFTADRSQARRSLGQRSSPFGVFPKLANSICVLSVEEAGRLEHWGVWPTCKNHIHIKKREAAEMINAETHRFVGGADTRVLTPVSMIVPVGLRGAWAPVQARNVDGSAVLGLRVWGLTRSS